MTETGLVPVKLAYGKTIAYVTPRCPREQQQSFFT